MNPYAGPTDADFRPDPAELAAWSAAIKRAREEYRAKPFAYCHHK